MKRLLFFFFFIVISITYAQVQNYAEGDVVADFTVTDVNGQEHNLYTYTAAGKYVFLDFFYKNCGGCQVLIPTFNEFYDTYGCNEGEVVCLAINKGVDNDAAVIEFENTYGGTFNHAPAISRNGGAIDVNATFNPYSYPVVCVIAPDNTLLHNKIWPINGIAELEAAFPTDFNPTPQNCTIGTVDFDVVGFNVFPNPLHGGYLNIEIPKVSTAIISIFNLLGKEVFSKKLTSQNTQITPNLPRGTYFIQLKTNKFSSVKKLIINNSKTFY